MIHALKPSDQVARTNFAVDMPERIDACPDFLRQVCFSNESTSHISGIRNRYKIHVTCEVERGSPKVNVWAGLMQDKLTGPFFFSEKAATGHSYLDILKLYWLPELMDRSIAWPPTSPDLTPQDFFLWGYVKNIVYMLQATWNEIEYRLDICRATKGAYTEIY
ncbi:hypothetical protein B7P43_G17047 [Cryptotermes secundus]|uniref:Uncharacterized protein n=1 Tax=Cryptotermes secundus TaxID=105785 RepID=A0A2J7RT47_9NEOP|nr:hypothetical protein B7P43_G17047 [Cryptotermes secundus]